MREQILKVINEKFSKKNPLGLVVWALKHIYRGKYIADTKVDFRVKWGRNFARVL